MKTPLKGKTPIRIASISVLCMLLLALTATSVSAVPINKKDYGTYSLSNPSGTKIVYVNFGSGMTAFNVYNLFASRTLLNSRIVSFSNTYKLGLSPSAVSKRTNAYYAVRVSYKARGAFSNKYP